MINFFQNLKYFATSTFVVMVVFGWGNVAYSQLPAQNANGNLGRGGGGDADPAKINTISVVHGATQSNMKQLPLTNVGGEVRGNQNWGCVKAPDSYVWVQVTLNKNDAATINSVDWHGQGAPLPGYDNSYRRFGKDESKKYTVKPTLGANGPGLREIYIWVIWSTYEIRISGDLDQTQKVQTSIQPPGFPDPIGPPISRVNTQLKWINILGGGSSLGAIDVCSHPSMTYAYSVGRCQGIAYLTPVGVEQRVNSSSWRMRRNVAIKSYENGSISANQVHGDNSYSVALDTDPTDNTASGPPNTIYDADVPGCSNTIKGIAIRRTSETYDNFTSWAAVVLDTEYRCSEYEKWAYKARLDGDLNGCKTTTNELYSHHIDISNPRFYDPR